MSATFSIEDVTNKLNWRYAVKRFDSSKKISSTDWNFLVEVLRLSPSSFGLQPWKFLLVENKAILQQLRVVSWNQPQVEECSHYLVLTSLKNIDAAYIRRYVEKIAKVRGVPVETLAGYEKNMLDSLVHGGKTGTIQAWSQRQVYIAMGNLMNAAALLNIDTCPMEGLDPAKYDEILKLGDTPYATVATVALGYRSSQDQLQHAKKVRFSADEILERV